MKTCQFLALNSETTQLAEPKTEREMEREMERERETERETELLPPNSISELPEKLLNSGVYLPGKHISRLSILLLRI